MAKKILIVEDEVSLRELYVEVLKDASYDVFEVGDGESGSSMITTLDWDLLILDIMLPRLDGIEVLRKLSANSAVNKRPVIVLSNLDTDAIMKQCFDLGAKDYLIKSNITPQQLLECVNKCFR